METLRPLLTFTRDSDYDGRHDEFFEHIDTLIRRSVALLDSNVSAWEHLPSTLCGSEVLLWHKWTDSSNSDTYYRFELPLPGLSADFVRAAVFPPARAIEYVHGLESTAPLELIMHPSRFRFLSIVRHRLKLMMLRMECSVAHIVKDIAGGRSIILMAATHSDPATRSWLFSPPHFYMPLVALLVRPAAGSDGCTLAGLSLLAERTRGPVTPSTLLPNFAMRALSSCAIKLWSSILRQAERRGTPCSRGLPPPPVTLLDLMAPSPPAGEPDNVLDSVFSAFADAAKRTLSWWAEAPPPADWDERGEEEGYRAIPAREALEPLHQAICAFVGRPESSSEFPCPPLPSYSQGDDGIAEQVRSLPRRPASVPGVGGTRVVPSESGGDAVGALRALAAYAGPQELRVPRGAPPFHELLKQVVEQVEPAHEVVLSVLCKRVEAQLARCAFRTAAPAAAAAPAPTPAAAAAGPSGDAPSSHSDSSPPPPRSPPANGRPEPPARSGASLAAILAPPTSGGSSPRSDGEPGGQYGGLSSEQAAAMAVATGQPLPGVQSGTGRIVPPPNAWILYYRSRRQEIVRQRQSEPSTGPLPKLPGRSRHTEMLEEIRASWARATAEERAPFEQMARAALDAFRTAHPNYRFKRASKRRRAQEEREREREREHRHGRGGAWESVPADGGHAADAAGGQPAPAPAARSSVSVLVHGDPSPLNRPARPAQPPPGPPGAGPSSGGAAPPAAEAAPPPNWQPGPWPPYYAPYGPGYQAAPPVLYRAPVAGAGGPMYPPFTAFPAPYGAAPQAQWGFPAPQAVPVHPHHLARFDPPTPGPGQPPPATPGTPILPLPPPPRMEGAPLSGLQPPASGLQPPASNNPATPAGWGPFEAATPYSSFLPEQEPPHSE